MREDVRSRDPEREVLVSTGSLRLPGTLGLPAGTQGVVLFAHGSGSSRHSPRNRYVARVLRQAGIGTLSFDLLTLAEESADGQTGHLRFNIPLLARRVVNTIDWLGRYPETRTLRIGCFGTNTGAAAMLVAAAERPEAVRAVVSRGGRPDLALTALPRVHAPTLLLVGEEDRIVLDQNRLALAELRMPKKELRLIKGASPLFEEPGTLEAMARLTTSWFIHHLIDPAAIGPRAMSIGTVERRLP